LVDWSKIQFTENYITKLDLFFAGLKKYVFQRLLERKIDLKIFLNPKEMKSHSKKAVYIPHVVNPEIRYTKPRKGPKSINLLFLGTYNHPPNRLSFDFMIEEIIPILIKKTKNFRVWIVGPGTEKYSKKLENSISHDFVKIKGFVKNINDVFDEMDIALFPILYGGGMKTKVIEAMAAGLPVITFPPGIYGMEKLPSECIEVSNNPHEMVNSIFLLINNYQLRLKKSIIGKDYIKNEHSFENLGREVLKYYKRL
jgi:glycosyltransferase involved in cell wall biosynthesis